MSISFSASSIEMFSRCPRQYYYRYVLGMKIPPSAALVLGISFHHTMEFNFRQKVQSDIDLPVENLIDVFSDKFEEAKCEVDWAKEERSDGQTKDVGISMVYGYTRKAAPLRKPLLVEHEFEIDLEGIKLNGTIDLVQKDNTLVELKTSRRSWPVARAEKALQPVIYCIALSKINAEWPSRVFYDVVTPPGEVQIIETYKNPQKVVSDIVDRLATAEKLVTAGLFPKCSPQNWYCSPEWCGYYEICMK